MMPTLTLGWKRRQSRRGRRPRPQHQDRRGVGDAGARARATNCRGNAGDVRVKSGKYPRGRHDRIDRTNRARERINRVKEGHHRLLAGHRDRQAAALRINAADQRGQIVPVALDAPILPPADPERLPGCPVNHRGQRVLDRGTDNAGPCHDAEHTLGLAAQYSTNFWRFCSCSSRVEAKSVSPVSRFTVTK